eukprot:NODE_336_length_10675_cov_0.185136.p10 type:complete len:103 gc:universal NODE_336_length_10675_cov_0.185136:4666-4358(-)
MNTLVSVQLTINNPESSKLGIVCLITVRGSTDFTNGPLFASSLASDIKASKVICSGLVKVIYLSGTLTLNMKFPRVDVNAVFKILKLSKMSFLSTFDGFITI